MTDLNPTSGATPAPTGEGSQPVVTSSAVAATSGATGGGVKFDFVFNGVTYTVQVYAPDANGQYGFVLTQATTTIASLAYKDENDWAIVVGLPSALQVDTNLTVNTFSINIAKGSIAAFSS